MLEWWDDELHHTGDVPRTLPPDHRQGDIGALFQAISVCFRALPRDRFQKVEFAGCRGWSPKSGRHGSGWRLWHWLTKWMIPMSKVHFGWPRPHGGGKPSALRVRRAATSQSFPKFPKLVWRFLSSGQKSPALRRIHCEFVAKVAEVICAREVQATPRPEYGGAS